MGITQRYKLCQKERDQDYCKAPNNKNKSMFEEGDAHISSLPRHDSSALLTLCSLRSYPRAFFPLPHLRTMLAMDLQLYRFLCPRIGILCTEVQGLLLNNFLSANRDAIGLAFTAWSYSHTTLHLRTLLLFHHNIDVTRNYYNHFIDTEWLSCLPAVSSRFHSQSHEIYNPTIWKVQSSIICLLDYSNAT